MKLALRIGYALIVVVVTRFRFRWWSPRTIARYQRRRHRAITRFAHRYAPAYRDAKRPVRAHALRARFADANTVGLDEPSARRLADAMEANPDPAASGPFVGYSSGTSGDPGLFVVSEREAWGWAGLIFSRLMPGSPFTPRRIAFFLRANSPLYEQLSVPWVQFEHFGLSLDDDVLIDRLETLAPDVLFAPPSTLRRICALVESGRLTLAPQHIFAGAEMLWPDDRRVVAETFSIDVREVYQATEGIMAVTCLSGSLHWQEDLVALGERPGPGPHPAVVTALHRRAQPIVDVALGDLVTVEPERRCACGSAFRVVRVEGRLNQVCHFENDVALTPRMLGHGLCSLFGVDDFRIRQHRTDGLTVHLSTSLTDGARRTLEQQVRTRLMATLDEAGASRVHVAVAPEWIVRPRAHKRVRVVGHANATTG